MVYPPEESFLIGPREEEIIRNLLQEEGITTYAIVEPVNEGQGLSDAPEDRTAWSTSGYIVTPTTVHDFWLDWDTEHHCYTLGLFFDSVYDEEQIKSFSVGSKLLQAQEYLKRQS